MRLVVGDESLNVLWHGTAVGLAILLWIDQRAEFDEMGHGIQVDGMGLATEPQCLYRDGPAPRERVKYLRRITLCIWVQNLVRSTNYTPRGRI